MAESIIPKHQLQRIFLLSANTSDTTWKSVIVSLDEYKFILCTTSNSFGRIYLSQLIPKDLFILLNSSEKCFAPEVFTGNTRQYSEFFYNNGAIYYKHTNGDLINTLYGIK